MGAELQEKLLPLFDYALSPGGVLFLGTSESVGDFGTLFATLDRKAKLYQDRDDGRHFGRAAVATDVGEWDGARAHQHGGVTQAHTPSGTDRAVAAATRGTRGALVNDRGDILYLHGRTGKYLELPTGEAADLNILQLAREGLHRPLNAAFRRAVTKGTREFLPALSVKTNGDYTSVDLTIQVVPPRSEDSARTMFLIMLEDSVEAPRRHGAARRCARPGEHAAAGATRGAAE